MKPFLLLYLFIGSVISLKAQTFTSNTVVNILDNALVFSPVQVNGLPTTIDSTNFGLLSVCVNISHTYVGQLDLYLKSPNGTLVKLVNNKGGNGINYTNSCFAENGILPIASGVAPFLGTFIPEASINLFNNGIINPNGTWYFGVMDEVPYNTGKINSFTLLFGNNPPPTPVFSVCSIFNGAACKCPDGTQDCDLLPDMTNSAQVIQTAYYDDPGLLHIGVGTPNIGYGPLEVRGTGECFCDTVKVTDPNIPCPNGNYPKEKVVQRIYHKSGSSISYTDKFAGYMQYHPAHGHVHIDNWTYNTLRIKGPQADPLKWPIIGRDSKISFCLINNYNCSANLGYCKDVNGNPLTHSQTGNPGLGIASGCGREQGIFPGYLDIYFPGYDGQELHIDSSTCNGIYYVVSVTDPLNDIKEVNENNNISVVPVFLSFQTNGTCCKNGFFADTTFGIAPFTVNFVDTTKPSSKKWLWDFGDGFKDTVQFPKHVYTQAGNYTVSLKTTALNTNCTDSTTKQNYIRVRQNASTASVNNVSVYPNPFTTYLNVFYSLKNFSEVSINVYDILGRIIYASETNNEYAGLYEKKIKLTNCNSGIYIVKVKMGDEVKSFKVIKP